MVTLRGLVWGYGIIIVVGLEKSGAQWSKSHLISYCLSWQVPSFLQLSAIVSRRSPLPTFAWKPKISHTYPTHIPYMYHRFTINIPRLIYFSVIKRGNGKSPISGGLSGKIAADLISPTNTEKYVGVTAICQPWWSWFSTQLRVSQ